MTGFELALPPIDGLQGVYAAAITPRGKNGELNFGALYELIDSLSAARVNGIALFTGWGEYPAFTVDDRARLTYLAVKRSRVPVLAGVGSATLDHSLELAREARAAGVAALLLPPPLYYRYDPDDIVEFYSQFAAQLGAAPPIVATGDLPLEARTRLLESGRFASLEEDDRALVAARTNGLGVLSGAAGAAPELTMALNAAIVAGRSTDTAHLEAMWRELLDWLDRFPVPAGVKTAVSARGIQTGPLPVPLTPAKQQCLEQFREWFKAWLPSTKKLATHA